MSLRVELRHMQGNEPAIASEVCRRRALHCGEHAAGLDQMSTGVHETRELGKGARDHHGEALRRLPLLDAAVMNLDIAQAELEYCLPEKRRLLLARLGESHAPLGPRRRERN